ncbi:MAG: hypothetical protein R2856_04790 [Caldilineaceae bacterium]
MGAGALIIILVFIMLFLLRGNGEDVADVEEVTPAAAAELGSVTFPESQTITVTAEVELLATPMPIFEAGQRAIVANTEGQGIRLRNQPNRGALTLRSSKKALPSPSSTPTATTPNTRRGRRLPLVSHPDRRQPRREPHWLGRRRLFAGGVDTDHRVNGDSVAN